MPFGRHYSEITVNLKDNTQNNSISSPNPEGMPSNACSPEVQVEPDAGEQRLDGDVDPGGEGRRQQVGVGRGGDEAQDDRLAGRPHEQQLEGVDLEELDEEVVGGVQDSGERHQRDAQLPGPRGARRGRRATDPVVDRGRQEAARLSRRLLRHSAVRNGM